jgi:hypothetical protein
MAVVEKSSAEMKADEAHSTCDEYPHLHESPKQAALFRSGPADD